MTFLYFKELQTKGIKFCRSYILRLERKGKFPKRVVLGESRVAWVESEIDAWIAKKLEARDLTPAQIGTDETRDVRPTA